jgi:sterol desaturase/sphingolipid hydroxylase (fatty acid hydroxylase superfamily)
MSSLVGRGARVRSVALHLGVIAGAAAAVSLDRRLRRVTKVEPPVVVGAAAAGWYSIIAAMERRHPYRPSWNESRDADVAVDGAFVASTFAVSLVSQPLGGAMAARIGLDLGLRRLPAPVAVTISVAAYDLAHTLLHRLGHEWGPAWQLHSVHHSPTRLYWMNATRFHVLETTVDGIVEAFILGVLGMSRDQHTGHLAVRALYGQLQHCNVDVDSGVLDRVFSTPDLHRWHHSVDYDEGDTNFGAVTSVWDQLLGSFFRPASPFNGTTGIGRMPNFPTGYLELQRTPFKWSDIRDRNADTWYVVQSAGS